MLWPPEQGGERTIFENISKENLQRGFEIFTLVRLSSFGSCLVLQLLLS